MTDIDEKEEKAVRRKVREMRHFYYHLSMYGIIIAFLHILNLMTSSYYWAIWPTLGWGVAIAMHAVRTHGMLNFFDEEWEERKVQELLAKKRGQH